MGGKPTPQTSQRVQLGCGACSTWLKPYKIKGNAGRPEAIQIEPCAADVRDRWATDTPTSPR
jgi:hypothetical protein